VWKKGGVSSRRGKGGRRQGEELKSIIRTNERRKADLGHFAGVQETKSLPGLNNFQKDEGNKGPGTFDLAWVSD